MKRLHPFIFGAGILAALVFALVVTHAQSSSRLIYAEVGFTPVSPDGLSGGTIVPASCELNGSLVNDPPGFGSGCSAANSCGQTNSGTITCGGFCSVGAPPDSNCPACPAGTVGRYPSCTSPTGCPVGTSGTYPICIPNASCPTGYVGTPPNCSPDVGSPPPPPSPPSFQCNGVSGSCRVVDGATVTLTWSCPAPNSSTSSANFSTGGAASGSVQITPSGNTTYTVVCNQTGTQASIQSVAVYPSISLSANPTRVHANGTSVLTWSALNVQSCTITGPSGRLASATADNGGTISSQNTTTPPITGQTTFTVNCQTEGNPVSKSVDITLIPNIIEI